MSTTSAQLVAAIIAAFHCEGASVWLSLSELHECFDGPAPSAAGRALESEEVQQQLLAAGCGIGAVRRTRNVWLQIVPAADVPRYATA